MRSAPADVVLTKLKNSHLVHRQNGTSQRNDQKIPHFILSAFKHHSMRKLYLLLLLLLISLSGFSQSRHISETTKKIVYTRDGGMCKCCGSSIDLEYDHITPYSCGGKSVASNIQLLCQKCNRSKSNSCYCKVHDRLVGTNCCDDQPVNKSPKTASQCSGTTKKGNRCKNKTTNATGRCHLH